MSTAQEVRFRTLIDRLGAAIWEATPGALAGEASFTYMSGGAQVLLGFPPERWMEDPRFWIENVHPDDRPRIAAEVREAVVQRRGADLEYRCFDAAGRERWVRNILQPNSDDDTFSYIGVVIDLTERRADEVRLGRLQELAEALARPLTGDEVAEEIVHRGRAIVEALAVALFLRTDDGLELTAYDGHPDADEPCVIPLDREVPVVEAFLTGETVVLTDAELSDRYPGLAGWRKLAGDGQLVVLPLYSDSGTLGSLALRLPATRTITHADRVVLEVLSRGAATALLRAQHTSAERAARRAAEDANAVLDSVITAAPEGFALFDRDLRYVRVNNALAAMNRCSPADHIGKTIAEVIPRIAALGPEHHLRQVLLTGRPVLDVELTGPEKNARTVLVSMYPVRGADGEIAFLGSIVTDITARKRGEQRAERLAHLGTLLDEVVSVEERMNRLVEALVPSLYDFCAISFRGDDGTLQRVAMRGEGVPDVSVPLVVRGRDLGVLAVGRHSFGHDEVIFAEEVGRRAALAVDNARLYEAEQDARDRSATQYALAAALAEALAPADVARAALNEVVAAVGTEQGAIWQVTEDGREFEVIGWTGFSDEDMLSLGRHSLRDRRPVADSIRARRTLWLASPEEIDRAYPAMADVMRGQRLRSIATIPLLSAGRVVGGMFLSSTQPYAMTADDLALAGALAAQAAQALERARFHEAERAVSVTLQRSLLPPELPEVDGVDFELRYLPAAGLEAGGDFYEALELPDGEVLFACGDVVGRGAHAAAAMGQLRSALRAFALMGGGPAEILSRLSTFADTIESAMAATAAVGKLDPATGTLRYACAGHPWPLLVHADARAEYLVDGRGVPLGCVPQPDYPEATVALAPGSTLLLYTDGLTERRDEDVAVVLERLRSVAAASATEPLGELLDGAVAMAGASIRADDIALVGLRLTGRGAATRVLTYAGALAEVPIARDAVRSWLSEQEVGGALAADMLLAAGEAFANAVEHSGSETVDVELTRPAARQVQIKITDRGVWRQPPGETDRGRGFGLMRALVDDCTIDHSAGGTVVRLRHEINPVAGLPPAMGGACTIRFERDRAYVAGDLDLQAAAGIGLELRPARVIDLSEVTYLDSTGARTLIGIAGAAIIAPVGSVARRTLDLSGLTAILDVRDQ